MRGYILENHCNVINTKIHFCLHVHESHTHALSKDNLTIIYLRLGIINAT